MLVAFKAAMIRDGCFGCAAFRWASGRSASSDFRMVDIGNAHIRKHFHTGAHYAKIGKGKRNASAIYGLRPAFGNTCSSLRTVSDIMHHARPHCVVTRGLLSHSTQSERGFQETCQPTAKRRGTPVQTSHWQETSSPLLLDRLTLACLVTTVSHDSVIRVTVIGIPHQVVTCSNRPRRRPSHRWRRLRKSVGEYLAGLRSSLVKVWEDQRSI